MSLSKVVGGVMIIGGIGAMAYLLLKKSTPTLAPKPAETIDTGATELDKLCAEKNPTQSSDVNLYNRCTENSKSKSEIWNPLVDPIALSVIEKSVLYNTDNAIYRSYYLPLGELKANTCGDLDILVKDMTSKLAYYSLLGSKIPSNHIPILKAIQQVRIDAEAKFNKFNCRDKIEVERTRNLIDIQTKSDIKAEESIIKSAFTEQKIYIVLGGLVLLTGFYIVIKK